MVTSHTAVSEKALANRRTRDNLHPSSVYTAVWLVTDTEEQRVNLESHDKEQERESGLSKKKQSRGIVKKV
jgi:hypothetical protein